jgi:hypothetical protein
MSNFIMSKTVASVTRKLRADKIAPIQTRRQKVKRADKFATIKSRRKKRDDKQNKIGKNYCYCLINELVQCDRTPSKNSAVKIYCVTKLFELI